MYSELSNVCQKLKRRDEPTGVSADTLTRVQERLSALDKQVKDMKVQVIEELQAWTIRNDNRIDDITRKIDNKIEDIAKALESRKDIAPLSTSNCPSGLDGKKGDVNI